MPEVRRFGDLSLEVARGALRRLDGTETTLRPKTAEVLRHLMQRADQVVSREELMQTVWSDVFVTDDNITQCVSEIRRALGDDAHLLRTLPKRGYLLASETAQAAAPGSGPAGADQDGAALPDPAPGVSAAPERRQITLLFCGLAAPVPGRLDPEDFHFVVASYQEAVRAAVEQHGGRATTGPGDWISVAFGWPVAQEDDAERAVRAALAARERVAALAAAPLAAGALRARVGVATGQTIVLEAPFSGAAGEGRVVGDLPSRAAALQAAAGLDCVVVDAATHGLIGRLFETSPIGEVPANGLSRPGPGFLVRGEHPIESRFEALRGARARLALIGREEELDVLQRRWRRAVSGDAQVVLISGEAGIGKSRLLAALHDSLAGDDHVTLRYSCSPYHRASALSPVIDQLRRAARLAPTDSPEELRRKLAAVLPRQGMDAEDVSLIAGLLARPEIGGPDLPDLSPQRRKEKTSEALVRAIAGHARTRTVLVTVEDAHWADPSTRDLLDLAIERLGDTACLLAITFRPEFEAPWLGRAGVTLMALSRLPPPQAAELALAVAGERVMPGGLAERIAARADGVPLFVEELTEALLGGEIALPAAPTAGSAIPGTLRASLAARLDRLPHAKDLLQLGAVIGRTFTHDLVADLSGEPEPKLSGVLDQIVASGLVTRRGTPPDAAYTFKHALVQEAAYDTLLRPRRVELHRRIARLLEQRFPEAAEREPEMLARHAALAGEAERAAHLLLRAGENAMRGYALSEAEAHLAAGLALVSGLPDDERRRGLELGLQTALGQAMMGRRGFADPATGVVFDRAGTLASGAVPSEKLIAVLHGNFMFHLVGGRIAPALDAAEQIRSLAERTGSAPFLLAARLLLGMPRFHMGEFSAAIEHWRTLPVGGPGGDGIVGLRFVSDFRALLEAYRSWALLVTGDVEAADRSDRAAWTAANSSRATSSNAGVFCFSCAFSLLRGDREAVRRKLGPTLGYCHEQRYALWLAIATLLRSHCMAEDDGASAASIGLYRRGLEAYRATGSSQMVPFFLGMQAGVLQRHGGMAEALPLVTEALELTRTNQDQWFGAELHRIEGNIWRSTGDEAAADASFQRAISLARSQGATLWELRAAKSRALLLRDQGSLREAVDQLNAARAGMRGAADLPEMHAVSALLAITQQ